MQYNLYVPNDIYPTVGQSIAPKDVDYDMMSYFSRTNRQLEIQLLDGKCVKASVGSFYNDLIFNAAFPNESTKHTHYSIQKKYFELIKIVG
jgi:hypothetical protein